MAGAVPTTRGLAAGTVFVGGLVSVTDARGPAQADAATGARARFARANAEGGVHGRRIELLEVVDDAGDPARAVAGARRLVASDGVLAVVPVASNALTADVRRVLDGAGIPYFGWGAGLCDARTAFGITGCWPAASGDPSGGDVPDGFGEALASPAFVTAVASRVAPGTATAIVGNQGAAGQAAVDRIAQQARAAGLRVVLADATVPADGTVADYGPWAQRVLTADAGRPAGLVIHAARVPDILGVSYQLRLRGYAGAEANPRTYAPAFAFDYPMRYAVDGALVATPFTPVEASGDPAVARATADLEAAGVSRDGLGSPALLAGYWAADLFLRLLDRAGADPTPAGLVAAADGFTYDGGGVGPSTWPAAHTSAVACTNLVRVTSYTGDNGLALGRFDVVGPRSCT